MRKNGLGRLYDRLTPKERFKLVMEAGIRGDKKESGQLWYRALRATPTSKQTPPRRTS